MKDVKVASLARARAARSTKTDLRKAPTASPAVSAGALKAVAAAAETATVEPSRASKPARSPKAVAKLASRAPGAAKTSEKAEAARPAPKARPAAVAKPVRPDAIVATTVAALTAANAAARPLADAAALAGPSGGAPGDAAAALQASAEQAQAVVAPAREAADALRDAMSRSAATATQGAVELHGKMLDLFRAQGDAAFALWRTTLSAGSLPEAVKTHAAGVREAYESGAARWKDIAETTARLVSETAKPLQSVLTAPRG